MIALLKLAGVVVAIVVVAHTLHQPGGEARLTAWAVHAATIAAHIVGAVVSAAARAAAHH